MYLKQLAVKINKIRNKQKQISFSVWQKILPKIETELKSLDNNQYWSARQALNTLKKEKTFKNVIHFKLPLTDEGFRLVFLAMEKHLKYLRCK